MANIITVAQALKQMETGNPFTLAFVKYDRRRRTGGELREIEARLCISDKKKAPPVVEGREMTPRERKLHELKYPDNSRNPNHRHWYTRNVEITVNGHPTGEIIKVHPPLFVEFNGMRVVP